jgi:GT2 family glycosyltransferase
MVTAIVVNYHSYLLTARAAASILVDQPDAQVIVVDNSESEAEVLALREVLQPQVECIIMPHNVGFGRACNMAYLQARYDWILLLNPDAFVLEGCCANLVAFMKQTSRAGAVAPLVYWDKEQTWLLAPGQLPVPLTELGMFFALRWPWLGRKISDGFRRWSQRCLTSTQPIRQRMLSGGSMLLRRSAIESSGGLFDPDFFMYYEDTDLCLRLQKKGFQLYLLPSATAVHEWGAAPDKTQLCHASRQHYFNKHFPGNLFMKLLERLQSGNYPIRLPDGQEKLPTCDSPEFADLGAINSGRLEISPHPLFVPAIYYFGNTNNYKLPVTLRERLGLGDYWARSSGSTSDKTKIVHWRVA